MNGAKGHSALQLSRDLTCQYKTAFVLAHKLREALAAEKADATVSGEVAVDGAYFGGYVKPAEPQREPPRPSPCGQSDRQAPRRRHRPRERRQDAPFVFKTEAESVATIAERIEVGSTVHADEATHWDALHSRYLTKRINHQEAIQRRRRLHQ